MDTLETMTDRAVYEALQQTSPRLVAAIRDLIRRGQTPAQIERQIAMTLGRDHQMTRNVRHVAEHLTTK